MWQLVGEALQAGLVLAGACLIAYLKEETKRHRLVLLGTTGSGKSTSGNYLLSPQARSVFKVQHGPASGTARIEKAESEKYPWCVVDTPGMGDVPSRQHGQTDDAYDEACRKRRVQIFTDITSQLNDHGGVVVYVLEHGRLTPEKQRHLKAVNLVLHRCFTSSVVLLLTNVPDMADIEYRMQGSDLAAVRNMQLDASELVTAKYMQWLSDARAEVERQCGLRFAAVLGACRPSAAPDHPAHPRHLPDQMRSLLSAADSRERVAGLEPGVATSWTDVVRGYWDDVDYAEYQYARMRLTEKHISHCAEERDRRAEQVQVCRKFTAPVAVAASVVVGFIPPVVAAAAKTKRKEQLQQASADMQRYQQQLRQQRSELEQRLGPMANKKPQQLKQHAEEIQRLISG
uniref:AIG1-type G domain-containing protein n=1 Tax=Tetradesmus obliquus TaxID=3088 RepID=A0A383VKE0_TETOB|eukprot:jgi/Sobl393_1/8249/SZX65202.1